MKQNAFEKSKISNSTNNQNHIWKFNDAKAQKNGPHSNIYWVKVFEVIYLETTIKLRWIGKIK